MMFLLDIENPLWYKEIKRTELTLTGLLKGMGTWQELFM